MKRDNQDYLCLCQHKGWNHYIKKYGRITRAEYEKLSHISARTASRELEELCKKGVIEKKGKGPAVYYLLARFGEIKKGRGKLDEVKQSQNLR